MQPTTIDKSRHIPGRFILITTLRLDNPTTSITDSMYYGCRYISKHRFQNRGIVAGRFKTPIHSITPPPPHRSDLSLSNKMMKSNRHRCIQYNVQWVHPHNDQWRTGVYETPLSSLNPLGLVYLAFSVVEVETDPVHQKRRPALPAAPRMPAISPVSF